MRVREIATLIPTGPIKSVCVFCGAREGDDPAYLALANSLGRAVARADLKLIYGGGGVGLMGAVARAAIREGGRVTGIIPSFLIPHEEALGLDHELIVVDDMTERKQAMAARADAFIALPGGLGTLEEIAEQISWARLSRHAKPIILLDTARFWRPLTDLFEHMAATGFCSADAVPNVVSARDPEEAIARLVSRANPASPARRPPRAKGPYLLNEIAGDPSQHDVFHCPM